ncbi:MAG: esterase family protein [Gammaproteobacteria bacterium]|nr:esterase family protein [Gammaproteobacteria bacterium]
MKTHLKFANEESRSDTLLVFLPGAFLKPEEFEREGFVDAVRERDLAADALLVDADVSYYYDQTFVQRLQDDVIQPQRALGYKSIWLVGISIGGFGALIHELANPGTVDGIVTLAPYLGRRPVGAEIAKAGGLKSWKAPEGPPPDQEVDRKLWPWLQQYTAEHSANKLPPLYLGFGLADRFAPNHRLLADALPAGHSFTTEGGHDWPQWARLWRDMLGALPLPSRTPAHTTTASRARAPAPAARPAAIAA